MNDFRDTNTLGSLQVAAKWFADRGHFNEARETIELCRKQGKILAEECPRGLLREEAKRVADVVMDTFLALIDGQEREQKGTDGDFSRN